MECLFSAFQVRKQESIFVSFCFLSLALREKGEILRRDFFPFFLKVILSVMLPFILLLTLVLEERFTGPARFLPSPYTWRCPLGKANIAQGRALDPQR